jgi:MFS family permease
VVRPGRAGRAVHHGLIVGLSHAADVGWTVISVMVVVAVSYLLAGTVAEALGPGRRRAFWLLRSIGLVAYLVIAASGNAGIATMLRATR